MCFGSLVPRLLSLAIQCMYEQWGPLGVGRAGYEDMFYMYKICIIFRYISNKNVYTAHWHISVKITQYTTNMSLCTLVSNSAMWSVSKTHIRKYS